MKPKSKVLVISIKPEFSEKIFSGQKTIELRKSAPNVSTGDIVVIYSTKPVMAIIGICEVGNILKLSPTEMWNKHHQYLGIDQIRFDDYFQKMEIAIGLELKSVCRFERQFSLSLIKSLLPNFHPPQTFHYYTKIKVLKTYCSLCLNF